MDHFNILIRLLTSQGIRSDIVFDFDAMPDSQPLMAAARACFERADMMPTSGGIFKLEISVSDRCHKRLEIIRIRTQGTQAVFEAENAMVAEPLGGFTLESGDSDMFHLAAHGLLAERQARAMSGSN